MSNTPSIQDVERRTTRLMNFEDGFWDLLLGAIFMLLAAYPITRARLGPAWNLGLFIALMIVALALYATFRRFFAMPRLGYAKGRGSPKLKVLLVVTAGLVILTITLVILTLRGGTLLSIDLPAGGPAWLRVFFVDIMVLVVEVGIFSAMGFMFGVERLYLYGWLLGVSNLAAAIIYDGAPEGFNLPLGLAASVILAFGVVRLVRFVRKYPIRMLDA